MGLIKVLMHIQKSTKNIKIDFVKILYLEIVFKKFNKNVKFYNKMNV